MQPLPTVQTEPVGAICKLTLHLISLAGEGTVRDLDVSLDPSQATPTRQVTQLTVASEKYKTFFQIGSLAHDNLRGDDRHAATATGKADVALPTHIVALYEPQRDITFQGSHSTRVRR